MHKQSADISDGKIAPSGRTRFSVTGFLAPWGNQFDVVTDELSCERHGAACAPQIFRPAENCREFVSLGLATKPGRVAARFGMRMLVLVDRRTLVRLLRDAQVRRAPPLFAVAAGSRESVPPKAVSVPTTEDRGSIPVWFQIVECLESTFYGRCGFADRTG